MESIFVCWREIETKLKKKRRKKIGLFPNNFFLFCIITRVWIEYPLTCILCMGYTFSPSLFLQTFVFLFPVKQQIVRLNYLPFFNHYGYYHDIIMNDHTSFSHEEIYQWTSVEHRDWVITLLHFLPRTPWKNRRGANRGSPQFRKNGKSTILFFQKYQQHFCPYPFK